MQQLPTPRFPAGVSAPTHVFLGMMVAAAVVVALVFVMYGQPAVPPAVLQSQQSLVSEFAEAVNASYRIDLEEIEADILSDGHDDAKLLAKVVSSDGPWSGAVILNAGVPADPPGRGFPVPVESRLPDRPTTALITPDGPALMLSIAVDEARTLVALQPITMRNLRLNPDARHGVYMLGPSGDTTLLQGMNAVGDEVLATMAAPLIGATRSSASAYAADHADTAAGRELVLASAPIGSTGLVVMSLLTAEATEGASLRLGLILSGSMLLAAGLTATLLYLSQVRPVRRLVLRAISEACDDPAGRRLAFGNAETVGIARALAVSSNSSLRARRWRPSTSLGLVTAAAVSLSWSVGVAVVVYPLSDAPVPNQLLIDQENQVESLSASLGRTLDEGLTTIGRLLPGKSTPHDQIAGMFRRHLQDDGRFRAIYQIDALGRPVVTAGRQPLRAHQPVPGELGIVLASLNDRIPVIYAYWQAADGSAVVGEFDLENLLGIVRRADGNAHVVDAEMRTILDSQGYVAFEPMRGSGLQDAAVRSLPGGTVGSMHDDGGGRTVLIASSAMTVPASVAHLEWTVVLDRDASTLQLPQMLDRRWSLLTAGLVAGVTVLTVAWQHFIFVRPLRRLARAADQISSGVFDFPVSPQRHDEIGSVAVCLEICRQVRHTGSARFGGAVRLRGSEDDFTAVLAKIVDPQDQPKPAKV
jgi:HAMP domain-containing protein